MGKTMPTQSRPFDIIPNELLSGILICTSAALYKKSDTVPRFYFPFAIAPLVSHRWRDVSQGTPQLWTAVRVDEKTPAEFVSQYLSRSGCLRFEAEVRNAKPDTIHILNQHAGRCDSLGLWGSFLRSFLWETIAMYPNLRHFSCISPDSLLRIAYLASCGSSLESISFLGSEMTLELGPKMGLLTALTELVLEATSDDSLESDAIQLLNLLRNTPHLKRLVIANVATEGQLGGVPWATEATNPVELHNLKEMILVDLFPPELFSIVKEINCPNLVSIVLGFHNDTAASSVRKLARLDRGWILHYPCLTQIHISPLDRSSILMLAHLPHVPTLGILGSSVVLRNSPSDKAIEEQEAALASSFVDIVPEEFRASVQTLKIRGLGDRMTRRTLQGWFPNLNEIRIQYEDAMKDWVQGPTRTFGGLVNVKRWEDVENRDNLNCFRTPKERLARRSQRVETIPL